MFAEHPVEIVFAVLVAVAFVYTVHLNRRFYFYADDWLVIRQAGSFRGIVRPYNNQLSIFSLGAWRVFVIAGGFDYTLFRVAGALSFFAIPTAYFFTMRRQFGAVLAALIAIPLVWYGRYVSLNPSEMSHYLALLGGVGCAAALNRGRRADWVLGVALGFSLLSAGGGIAVAAACVVHNLCTRPPLRRWLSVLVPSGLWFTWWLIDVHGGSNLGPYALSTTQTLQFVRDLAYTPFQAFALGVAPIAVVLIVSYVGYGIWAVSKGLANGANMIAWSVAVLVWAVGVTNSRGVLSDPTAFRYRYVALGMVLFAIVPRRPIVWPDRFPIGSDWRWIGAGALVVLALGTARAFDVRSDMRASAATLGPAGQLTRAETLVLGLGPDVVPDRTTLPFAMGALPARDLRALLEKYGNPFPATLATADRQLLDMKIVRAVANGTRSAACTPLSAPLVYTPTALTSVYLWSAANSFTVDVRRFGEQWLRLAQGRPGQALQLVLPGLNAAKPWQVRADGACRVRAATR